MSPGADSVINVHGHQHPGQPPSSTSLGVAPPSTSLAADSIVSDSACSVNSTARGSPRHQRMCQPHRFDRRTPDESSSQQSTSLGAVSAIDAVFRATQCAGIGSVSLLGRARDPLGRKLHNYGSVVNACVGARHNLPRLNNTVSLSCYDSKVGPGRTAIVPLGLVNAPHRRF